MLQIEEDLTARINMADYRFSFHEKGKEYNPASIAPEGKIIFIIVKNSCDIVWGIRTTKCNPFPEIHVMNHKRYLVKYEVQFGQVLMPIIGYYVKHCA